MSLATSVEMPLEKAENKAIGALLDLQLQHGHAAAVKAIQKWMNGVTKEGYDSLLLVLQNEYDDRFEEL